MDFTVDSLRVREPLTEIVLAIQTRCVTCGAIGVSKTPESTVRINCFELQRLHHLLEAIFARGLVGTWWNVNGTAARHNVESPDHIAEEWSRQKGSSVSRWSELGGLQAAKECALREIPILVHSWTHNHQEASRAYLLGLLFQAVYSEQVALGHVLSVSKEAKEEEGTWAENVQKVNGMDPVFWVELTNGPHHQALLTYMKDWSLRLFPLYEEWLRLSGECEGHYVYFCSACGSQ